MKKNETFCSHQASEREKEKEGKLFIIEFTVLENVFQVESEKFGCWWSLWMFYEFCIRFVHLNRQQTNGKLRNAWRSILEKCLSQSTLNFEISSAIQTR